jgi:hypothetical protein
MRGGWEIVVTEMDAMQLSIRHATNIQTAIMQSLISGIGLHSFTSPTARPFVAISGVCKFVTLEGWERGECGDGDGCYAIIY